ncbi:MAG TPA: hypothetical protein VLZ74_07775, partial [Methylocella sp.]|nr:hypothetical protein [Methylocella sp.]
PTDCLAVWSDYATTTLPSDQNFTVEKWRKILVTGPDGLNNVRTMIARGVPLAYGTRLYKDFAKYNGDPSPYVGEPPIAINKKTDKPVGHCLMIIGYNDNFGGGAVLLQNSFGTDSAYSTFQTLAGRTCPLHRRNRLELMRAGSCASRPKSVLRPSNSTSEGDKRHSSSPSNRP